MTDGDALLARAQTAKRAVVIEVELHRARSGGVGCARGIAVDVVAPEAVPMVKVLGEEVGVFMRALHEQHGVTFHLGTTAVSIDERHVTLKSGETLADLVVVGIGVHPAIALAEQAGIAVDRGVAVNEYLETSIPGIFAAGGLNALAGHEHTGERIRVEHWVVAERQGQTAARNILGERERFDAVAFFWTDQYDFSLAYVGHTLSVGTKPCSRDC